MALTYPHSNNIVLGAGRIFFATETSSTTEGTAYTYLGDTPGFTIGGTSEELTVDSSDTPVAEELVRIVKKVSRQSTVTLRDISPSNLALFFMGTNSSVTQTTGSGSTAITMQKGKYYKIGGDDVQDITVGTGGVHQGNATGAVIASATGTNWQYDATHGLIYFPTGTAATTGTVTVVYAKTASTWDKAITAASPVYGSLLFVADNTVGDNVRLKISRCTLAPNGEAAFKSRDNAMELAMTLGILTRDSSTPQIEVWGAPS
jgi:hypothetical protein